ncbi:CRAL TRIO domain-containing protein [Suillus subalutaceus]|uniref:CRAL TRIO domain-containing protein n=1 Tax=Suillus subalutaceus TaxID=48586 RepID=UPI001B86028F|nr:CRAL TRIO domain-containing protein [Suillus subalutaceus]KAG1839543.1 CRAL TRIO domain-containing protein [Suillus subalutaceus]
MSIHVPLPVPTQSHETALPSALSGKKQTLYDRVLEHFAAVDYTLPNVNQEKAALTVDEKFWLSYECLLRYLRATNWNADVAIERLEDTLKWRREFGIYDKITAKYIEPEVRGSELFKFTFNTDDLKAKDGKGFLFGFDTHGRPAIHLSPSKLSAEESPRTIQFIIWMLEHAFDLMGPGVETLALLVDYAGNTRNPSFNLCRIMLSVIQTHYPERLGLALIAHLPWFLNAFITLLTPFMDPHTRQKLVFNPVTNENGLFRTAADAEAWDADSSLRVFEPDQLIQEGWNGSQRFTYSHGVYWEALVKLCEKRRSRMFVVWHGMGGKVGIKEWDVKVAVRDETIDAHVDEDGALMENGQLQS